MTFGRRDTTPTPPGTARAPWRVLVVDDVPEVHETTRAALRGATIQGRPVTLLHAHDGVEAKRLLRRAPDIAVALIDADMENEGAGFDLVDWVHHDLGNTTTRLVLCSGQPAGVPEADMVARYDIDAYAAKADLDRNKLISTLTTALRNHARERWLQAQQTQLRHVINAVGTLYRADSRRSFCERVVLQLAELLGTPPVGLVVADERGRTDAGEADPDGDAGPAPWTVMAAVGPRFAALSPGLQLDELPGGTDGPLGACLRDACEVVREDGVAIHMADAHARPVVAWLPVAPQGCDIDPDVVRLFAINARTGYNRISLMRELEATNGELRQRTADLQQALADARAGEDAKMRFLSTISHELRTPLNAVLGLAEVIRDRKYGDDVARYAECAEDIRSSGQHLQDLVNDILDMSRLESGRYEVNDESVDVSGVIRQCGRMLRPRAERGGVTLVYDENAPGLRADERALRQILINLLTNAVKFTPPGGHVSLDTQRERDGALTIVVRDTGHGIPRQHLDRVFEPFEHADQRLARGSERGTGLGLAICRRLVDLYGGTLTLDSAEGAGTAARLTFPAERVLSDVISPVESQPRPASPTGDMEPGES